MTSALNPGHPAVRSNQVGVTPYEVVGACNTGPGPLDDLDRRGHQDHLPYRPKRWLCARDAVETPGAEGI